jgi:hypothetical protein
MEGGMAERDHARNTFEEIKRKMLDPALLEWVDGSTFKMRVFPLEPRQEKRIVLSYSQRLPSVDGQMTYRFPAGHMMDVVREWSAAVRIKDGDGSTWHSPSHDLKAVDSTARNDAADLLQRRMLGWIGIWCSPPPRRAAGRQPSEHTRQFLLIPDSRNASLTGKSKTWPQAWMGRYNLCRCCQPPVRSWLA